MIPTCKVATKLPNKQKAEKPAALDVDKPPCQPTSREHCIAFVEISPDNEWQININKAKWYAANAETTPEITCDVFH